VKVELHGGVAKLAQLATEAVATDACGARAIRDTVVGALQSARLAVAASPSVGALAVAPGAVIALGGIGAALRPAANFRNINAAMIRPRILKIGMSVGMTGVHTITRRNGQGAHVVFSTKQVRLIKSTTAIVV
jgi:hypothetical protein